MNKETIIEAARLSQTECSDEGIGNQVLVWPDGTVSAAVSDNDVVCLLHDDGTRTYPVLRIKYPMSAEEIGELLAEEERELARRAAYEARERELDSRSA